MPLYEYHCLKCNAEFEAIVPFSAADGVDCECCTSKDVERLASSFASSSDSASGGQQSFGPCGSSACAPSG